MFCTQCGAPLKEDASFCGNCGWRRASGQDVRAEVEDREARGLKLCVKCRSEIPLDATICHRCDAPQPGTDAFGKLLQPVVSSQPRTSQPPHIADVAIPALASIGRRIPTYAIDVGVLVLVSLLYAFV